ncbi:MAG: 6-pyruvoyl-tetrahydropterin synthase-related protein [Acidobacteriota bacterium]
MKSGAGEQVMSARVQDGTEQPLNWEQRLSVMLAKRRWLAGVVCCAVAAIATLPLFVSGFPGGDDAIKHYRWSTEFVKALKDGSPYPRWFPEANRGAGSPLPIYYPPLPFYVAAVFNAAAGHMLTAISLSCWLALALSGLTMYGFGRLTLSRPMSLIAAVFYMLMPYHIVDLYLGSAISEFWSFAWVPLIFYFIYRVSDRDDWFAAGGLALSYALLLQTHVPSAFLTSLSLPIFAISLTRDLRRLLRIAAGLALGAGISAIFVVPVLFERKYIQIGRVILRRAYRDYFLFEHSGSAFKSILSSSNGANYSLQAELAALAVLALLIVAGLLVLKKPREGGRFRLWRASLVVTAFSLFMTTRIAAPLYRLLPGLVFLLFPFRWLLVSSAGVSLLTAVVVSLLARDTERRTLKVVALSLIAAFTLTVSGLAIARAPLKPATLERRLVRREAPEYHPVWWDGERHDELERASVVVDSGDAAVQILDDRGINQGYHLNAQSESLLRLRPLFFPGWVARADGRPIEIRPSSGGNIEVRMEPGEHQLTLSFEDTWPRTAGKLISAVCIAGLLVLLLVAHRKKGVAVYLYELNKGASLPDTHQE